MENYDFKGREKEVVALLKEISNKPIKSGSHLYDGDPDKPIMVAAQEFLYSWTDRNKPSNYPAIIFLRVVLAANRNYNRHVKGNIERILTSYPKLQSLDDLTKLLHNKTREEFYKFWGHKNNRKYNVLRDLLRAAKELRDRFEVEGDFELMVKWGESIDINNLKDDPIGGIYNVGLATVQHLRMSFGIDTVKPDQRVMEVLVREFGVEKISQKKAIVLVEELSRLSGIKTRLVDLILVNYGSGYYVNSQDSNRVEIQRQIALKLLLYDIDENIIINATRVPFEVIQELKRGIFHDKICGDSTSRTLPLARITATGQNYCFWSATFDESSRVLFLSDYFDLGNYGF